ncbi:MAG TPA: MotA/TolQ/ExbB proton channel family protein [Syntrophales bacterium]|nr:MotA/TolQ/ExbB proton channel family protein [Syntrophales bacterium]
MVPQIITALILISGIFFLAFSVSVEKMGLIANLNALLIVLGGTFAATMMVYPWKRLLWTAKILKRTLDDRNQTEWTIGMMIQMARTYRTSGIRALEKLGDAIPEGLLKTGIELIAYQYSKEKIEQIMAKETMLNYRQYDTAYKVLYNMARVAPALGLVGTIVNLIRIFGNITDAQNLIGYMAVALLSTFYGVVLANLVFVPLSHRIKDYMDQEQARLELIQEGILDIHDQENPQALQCKLEALYAASIFTQTPGPEIAKSAGMGQHKHILSGLS